MQNGKFDSRMNNDSKLQEIYFFETTIIINNIM